MKHLSEEQLVLYHYGEGPHRPAVEEHLAACDSCRADYAGLKQVLAAVEAAPVPERGPAYGAEVFERLRPRLNEAQRAGWSWAEFFPPRRWVLAAAMAVLVLAAFLAGRFWPHAQSPAAATMAPEKVRERILLVAVGDHLERSQMVLVELVHAQGNGTVDISQEQQWAEELLGDNRLYRQSAAQAGQTGMTAVLEELERALMEIANSPGKIRRAELEQIRRHIEGQGILFKVRVFGSEVREREKAVAQQPSRGSL